MQTLLLIDRLVLAAVFLAASYGKLSDAEKSAEALVHFGIPEKHSRTATWLLGLTESVLAVLLIGRSTAVGAAVGIIALLVTFEIVLIKTIRGGHEVECHCFGKLHSEPVSPKVVARNFVLMSLAGAILLPEGPGISLTDLLGSLRPAEIVEWMLLAACLTLLIRLERRLDSLTADMQREDSSSTLQAASQSSQGTVHSGAEPPRQGLKLGFRFPRGTYTVASGSQVELKEIRWQGKWSLVVFTSPNCTPCKSLIPELQSWIKRNGDKRLMLVSRGELEPNQNFSAQIGESLIVDQTSQFSKRMGAAWTPAALLVHPDGRVASSIRFGSEAIGDLVLDWERKERIHPTPDAADYTLLPVRPRAPVVSLPNLQGQEETTDRFAGYDRIMILWDPSCPHCTNIQERLEKLRSDKAESLRFIYIVYSDHDVPEGFNLQADQILIDPLFHTNPLFQRVGSTPSAVLVDRLGGIATRVESGLDVVTLVQDI